MKTKELIEKLKKFNPEAEIVIEDDNGDYYDLQRIKQDEIERDQLDWLDEEEEEEEITITVLSI